MAQTRVHVVEVGARDGLQSEPEVLPTEHKVELIERAVAAGIRRIEVASFVNPNRVPQMADAEAVVAALPDRSDVTYIGLVLNERGFERAVSTAIHEINVVVPVTDTFSERNQGAPVAAMVEAWAGIARAAQRAELPASVVLSTAFGCPFEGEVPVDRVVQVATEVAEHAPVAITLADTIGVAVPTDVRERVAAVTDAVTAPVGVHFHNTRNTGLANIAAAVEAGVRSVDASLAGIGGCPFAPNATGNVPTEDVVYLLERMGYDTGIDIEALIDASQWLEQRLGRRLPGLLAKAGMFPAPD